MFILLGDTNMIITRLEIKKLHGIYDYNVNFKQDLTFLFGENGCGKTTILDIVSSIVTGRLYDLFVYRFDEICLSFKKTSNSKLENLRILACDGAFEATLNGDEIADRIENPRTSDVIYSRSDEELAFERHFARMYKLPQYLKENFSYIYLPLGRNSQEGIALRDSLSTRRRRSSFFYDKDVINKSYLNDSLHYVEEIVRDSCMKIASTENYINSKFRKNILTSSLKVSGEYEYNLSNLFELLKDENTLSNIEKNRDEYLKTLRAIGELNDETKERVNKFFAKYKDAFLMAQQDESHGHRGLSVNFLLLSTEFNRIKEIASQAQKIDKEKEENKEPITTFLNTVNAFFKISQDKKYISISDEGQIKVQADSPPRQISLYNLSSGEKQILIIFACLIFGLPSGQSGIYIIDEPEASLHLAWQKIFVESIRKVNNSIQLIFATHAPEIIGQYSNNAVKLRKKINPSAEVDWYDE